MELRQPCCGFSVERRPATQRKKPNMKNGNKMMNDILRFGIAGLTALVFPLCANAEPMKSCTNASWEGSYGYRLTGERIGGDNPGPRAAVGRIRSDGHGNLSGTETKSNNGVILQGLTLTGSYTMLADCTGAGVVTTSDAEVKHFDFVVVERGEEIIAIRTDAGRVTTFTATKQNDK
jgi:hypothetical protein